MATTNITTANNLTLKLWGKAAFKDAVKQTIFGKLIGKTDSSIIQVKDELNKSAGDRVRFRLRSLPSGAPVTGNSTLEGHEEGLTYSSSDLHIDMMRHAMKVDLGISQQRIDFDLRNDAKAACSEWWAERMDSAVINYLAGNTAVASTYEFAGNSITAPSTNRIIYANDATSKASIDAADKLSLSDIDRLVEKAKLASPTMRPANFGGETAYVMLLHPYQVHDLRTSTNTGQWLDIQKAAMQGGKISDNPIFSQAMGKYHGVLLVESSRVPTFSDYGSGGNVSAARALFMGAQSGIVSFGRGFGQERMKYTEKTFDYEDKVGIATSLIWGVQKTIFNSEDFGIIACDSAAASH